MARKFPFYYFSCTSLIDLVRLLVDSSEQQQMQKIILSFPWFCGNTIFASVGIVFIEWSQQLSFHLVYLVVVQSLSHVQLFCNPMDCSLPGSSIHRIMLVSGIQPSNSCILMYTCVYIYIYTHTLCQVLFHDRLLQSIKQSSQARILEWVAISFSMEFSCPRDETHISCLAGGSHLESPLFHQLRVLVAIGIEFNEKFFDISEIFN